MKLLYVTKEDTSAICVAYTHIFLDMSVEERHVAIGRALTALQLEHEQLAKDIERKESA